jgi:DNA-binding XRE family transcriptional regulator
MVKCSWEHYLTTKFPVVKIPFGMAKGHTFFGDDRVAVTEERKQFAALMRKVEAVRIRYGMTKTELAAELGANVDGVRAWMTGRTIGRKESIEKIREFLKSREIV